jgi:hypothetical protein
LDAALGLLFLAVYIVAVIGLAAAITYGVIRVFPTERNPKANEKPDKADAPPGKNGETAAGRLFRRSKRGRR